MVTLIWLYLEILGCYQRLEAVNGYTSLIILVLLIPATYLLFNLRAGKKQTERSDRIKWKHK